MKVEVDQTAAAPAIDPANKHVDQRKMDAARRLGGHGYSRARDQFALPTMTFEGWQGRQATQNAKPAR